MSLLGTHARFETRHRVEPVKIAPQKIAGRPQRNPNLFRLGGSEHEVLWQHADDGRKIAVHCQSLSDYAAVAAEAALPRPIGQDHGHVFVLLILLGMECPSEYRFYTQRFEEISARDTDPYLFSSVLARECRRIARVRSESGKHGVQPLRVRIVGVRKRQLLEGAFGAGFPQLHQLLRLFVLERTQKDGIKHGEDDGVGADP